MEQNKVRSYILYAIGEVFLVVVGILIALQVNNWNEEQSRSNAKNILISEIRNSLNTDLQNLQEVREDLNKKFDDGMYLAEFLESDQPVTEYNEVRLNEAFMQIGTIQEFTPIDLSFQELVSTGLVNRIRNDSLKILLFDHYNLSIREEGILNQRTRYSDNYSEQRFYYAPRGAFIEKNKTTLKIGDYKDDPFSDFTLDWERIRNEGTLPMHLDKLLGVYIGQQYLLRESERDINNMMKLIQDELGEN